MVDYQQIGIVAASTAACFAGVHYLQKYEDKIGRWLFWKINYLGNYITGNTLKQQLKKMEKESKNLENKL
jgi:hypothetical protein